MSRYKFAIIQNFCSIICKRASEEGWQLQLNKTFYRWKKGSEMFGEQIFFQNVVEAIHAACVGLEKKNNWNLEILVP